MPTYEYACKSCGQHLEVVQSFTDDALTVCPACDGPLRKVFGSIGITFKGSGFYKTDSRATSSSSSKGDGKTDAASSSSESKSSESKSSESTPSESRSAESKPAASTGDPKPKAAAAS